mmetsp:Transcript_18634/g.43415  ORF Transcript_18634/g.43415 Transcript_18634/m.43415 type:complete len:286 (-) Transcript_18634:296-1153(-)
MYDGFHTQTAMAMVTWSSVDWPMSKTAMRTFCSPSKHCIGTVFLNGTPEKLMGSPITLALTVAVASSFQGTTDSCKSAAENSSQASRFLIVNFWLTIDLWLSSPAVTLIFGIATVPTTLWLNKTSTSIAARSPSRGATLVMSRSADMRNVIGWVGSAVSPSGCVMFTLRNVTSVFEISFRARAGPMTNVPTRLSVTKSKKVTLIHQFARDLFIPQNTFFSSAAVAVSKPALSPSAPYKSGSVKSVWNISFESKRPWWLSASNCGVQRGRAGKVSPSPLSSTGSST